MKSPIIYEILETIEATKSESPRMYALYLQIQMCENTTDMARVLMIGFSQLDDNLTRITDELIKCKSLSTTVILPH